MYQSATTIASLGCLYLMIASPHSGAVSSTELSSTRRRTRWADTSQDDAIQSSSVVSTSTRAPVQSDTDEQDASNSTLPVNKTKKTSNRRKKNKKAQDSQPGGSSRAVVGDPTNPHPATKVIWQNDRNSQYPVIAPHPFPDTTKTDVDPLNGRFAGLGVQIDDKHVLADKRTYLVSTIKDGDPSFSPVNGQHQAPNKMNVFNPLARLTNPGPKKYELIPDLNNQEIGGTDLSLFQVHANGRPLSQPQTAAKVETNPLEFGRNSDCFVHGYGMPVGGGSSRSGHISPVFELEERTYVKAPLDMSRTRCGLDPANPHKCRLTIKPTDDYRVCPHGRGMPVYCGKEEKLTYMSQQEKNFPPCDHSFNAYHLPRLVGSLGLSLK